MLFYKTILLIYLDNIFQTDIMVINLKNKIIMENVSLLQILGYMFGGFVLFGYVTLGIITFIKTFPEIRETGANFMWKFIFLLICIFITPLFFSKNFKIIERD